MKKEKDKAVNSIKEEIANSIAKEKERYTVRDFYRHITTYKEHPVSMGWIMDLRQELIEWAQNDPAAMNPYEFTMKKGIPRQTAKDWCTRIPEFAEGFQIAKDFIALRREKTYIEVNPSAALARMMSFYDDDYRAQEERMSNLKKNEQGDQNKHITVIIPDMESKEN